MARVAVGMGRRPLEIAPRRRTKAGAGAMTAPWKCATT